MPEWFVSEAPSDSVARTRFGAAATAPRVRVSDAALDHRTVWFEVLPGRGQAELLEAAERGQISGQEGSVRHVEVFRMASVRTSIIERPRSISLPPLGQVPWSGVTNILRE